MPRITTPAETSPEGSRPLLQAVKKQLGSVPNLFRIVATSPAALEGYLGLNGALAKGKLDARRASASRSRSPRSTAATIASPPIRTAKNLAKLDDAEIAANRSGASNDPKADAAVQFAAKVATERGHVTNNDLEAVRAAGFGDAEIIEIVLHVALNTLTNYVNEVAETDIDFPKVAARKAA